MNLFRDDGVAPGYPRTASKLLLALFLASTGAGAQPLAGGALQTLEINGKSAAYSTFKPVCVLDANLLEQGGTCADVPSCDNALGAPCELHGGLDHVAAGTGLRNSGHGVIQLRGAPVGAVPVAAWLYWGIITSDADHTLAHQVVFNHRPLTGTRIGSSRPPCWPTAVPGQSAIEFAAYRAQVLELLGEKINHDYAVSLPIASTTSGENPWSSPAVRLPLIEGASLVVVYAHPDVPRTARFYLHEGPELLIDKLVLSHDLDPPLPAARELRHTRLGADGQRQAGYNATAPFVTTLTAEGLFDKPIRGPGSLLDPSSDWQGADGGNQLWDTQVTVVPLGSGGAAPGLGSNQWVYSYQLSYEVSRPKREEFYFDCVAVVAHAMTAR